MIDNRLSDALFPRSFRKDYPRAMRGEGCFLFTSEGKQYLDAAGGAAVVTIGHGVESIGRAMAAQAQQLAYVHSSQFSNAPAEQLAVKLLEMAPPVLPPPGAFILLPAVRKPPKPRSNCAANFIWKPASRGAPGSFPASRAITARRWARCRSPETPVAASPLLRCSRTGARSFRAIATAVRWA